MPFDEYFEFLKEYSINIGEEAARNYFPNYGLPWAIRLWLKSPKEEMQ